MVILDKLFCVSKTISSESFESSLKKNPYRLGLLEFCKKQHA